MKNEEIEFLERHIIKLISGNKKGISLETVLEYLDYVNKVAYKESEINPILEKLIQEQKIFKEESLFIISPQAKVE